MESAKRRLLALKVWFELTPDERLFIGGILVIVLIGLIARYVHLKNQKAEAYEPQGLEQTE